MVRNTLLTGLVIIILNSSLQAQHLQFGTSSRQTLDQINKINKDFDNGRMLAGLAATYNLGDLEDRSITNKDISEYITAFNFINSIDDPKRNQMSETINALLADDKVQGDLLLTKEERGFWYDLPW